jgi:hypothetical protein
VCERREEKTRELRGWGVELYEELYVLSLSRRRGEIDGRNSSGSAK